MNPRRLSLVVALLLFSSVVGRVPAVDKAPTLTAEDKKYLDGLMKEFLFDPNGAERVTVKVVVRTVWASSRDTTAEGWLVAGKDGKPGRVFFTDGASMPAPDEKEMKKIDFKAACKARYAAVPKKKDENEFPDRDETFRKMRETALGAVDADDLTLAAWLYRLGDESLAAQALAAARKMEGDPRKRLRAELAWSAFAGMVHAYMVRADEEALAHGERLLRLYPEEAKEAKDKEDHYRQAPQIVEELKRRQKKGTFGKAPSEKWPDGFDKWESKKKVAYLIDALEEVDARQWGQPGGVDLASDRRVEELMRVGDAAVPALIDALESDERLTRSVHFWRDFARSRTVLGVREAVLTALMSILRVQVFEPASTGDNFTARGEEAAKAMAKRLRAYWKEYGDLPFDERMMKVLTDPKTIFAAKREAAENLATLTEDRRLRTTIHPTVIGADPPRKLNPVIAKFSKPTVAEAILTTMDAELKAHDAQDPKSEPDRRHYLRSRIEGTYLSALVELGDERIAPELAKRAVGAKPTPERQHWAEAAFYLGDPKPFRSFAEDVHDGKIKASSGKGEDGELGGIVGSLISVNTAEAGRALAAIADAKHPLHKAVAQLIREQNPRGIGDGPWFAHPFCLSLLRADLEDTSPTGKTYVIEDKTLWLRSASGGSGGGIPEFLADPKIRRDKVEQRVCDAAADKLAELVVGLPLYHPMFNDADKRLATFKAAFDRFGGNYRRATGFESHTLNASPWAPTYLPNILPLDHAATADDVKAGKAIFHLDGKGKPADLKLPAVATLKKDEKAEQSAKVLIVQAEVGADSRTTYGIISKEAIRALPASELTGIKTFADLKKEAKEAAEKEKVKKD